MFEPKTLWKKKRKTFHQSRFQQPDMKNMLLENLGEYLNPSFILVRRAVPLSASEVLLRMSTSKLEMNPKLHPPENTPWWCFYSPLPPHLGSPYPPLTQSHILLHANVSVPVRTECGTIEAIVCVYARHCISICWLWVQEWARLMALGATHRWCALSDDVLAERMCEF